MERVGYNFLLDFFLREKTMVITNTNLELQIL